MLSAIFGRKKESTPAIALGVAATAVWGTATAVWGTATAVWVTATAVWGTANGHMSIYNEAIAIQEVTDSPIKNLQDAINELTVMEASFSKVTKDPKIVGSLMFLKEVDLISVLDATVYNAKIDNKLCDVKMIISSIKKGFNNLVCTQVGCIHKAVMIHKISIDAPAELYWKEHLNLVDIINEDLYDIDAELRKDILILESLEKLLVVVQEQIEYLKTDNPKRI